ncbi:MAG TPA: ATP-binding cassette domain-containing protein [Longimicrobiales bacterium]|nr:ATP-binding cassette domain-containing protein [Longimicrobiales bacterium]
MERNGATPAIELRGVSKTFGDFPAVRPLDLRVPRGATYGLLGPNGAGKTTTIRMILRILESDTGSILILGEPQSQRGLDRIGYLPEERGIYRRMKVRRLLSFFAELKGMSPRAARPRIDEWLERLELADRADARLQELSKGMQQKIQFIGAVLHEPDVVILDEPFSGLDPINQRVLREIITELKRAGRTILFSTHIIDHAERICDHVCIIARGSKVADGPIPEVKRAHGSEYVAITLAEWSAPAIDALRRQPQVAELREHGNTLELRLRDGADPQRLLQLLVRDGVGVKRFEIAEPSLEQIFIERVGAHDDEVSAALEAAHV